MKSDINRARGSIVIVVVVVLVLVGALGFVGWRILTRQDTDNQAAKSSQTSAEVILTQEDLDAAEKSLDEIDFSDQSAEDAQLQANL